MAVHAKATSEGGVAGTYNGAPCSDAEKSCLGCYCDALLYASPVTDLSFCPGQFPKVLRVYAINVSLTAMTTVLNLLLQARFWHACPQSVAQTL
jgi:hypothetical protein